MDTVEGRIALVARASESSSNPRNPGFDLLAGQGEKQFCLYPSESTHVQTCLCLTAGFVCTARTQMCAHVKDPISICRKRVGAASQPDPQSGSALYGWAAVHHFYLPTYLLSYLLSYLVTYLLTYLLTYLFTD